MEPDRLSIAFKAGGSWTTKIYKELSSSLDRLEVCVEGPYGPASNSFLKYRLAFSVFISLCFVLKPKNNFS